MWGGGYRLNPNAACRVGYINAAERGVRPALIQQARFCLERIDAVLQA